MSFFRSFILISLTSLLTAAALFFLGAKMSGEEFLGGYAVLSADASIDDRTLRSLLEPGESFFSGSPAGESSQWVMLDAFDNLQAVPLDAYFLRVASFDPRNDGYAEKLKNVFVRDGKRFVYIPLKAGSWNPSKLDKLFKNLLNDISFNVEYYGIGRPLPLFFIAYGASALCLLVIFFVKRKTSPFFAGLFALVPVLFPLSFFGAAGLGAAALFFALFILLKEPFNELVFLTGSELKGNKDKFKIIYNKVILPYIFYWLLIPVFAAAFAGIVIFSQLKLLFLLAVFTAAFIIFLFSLFISVSKHRRFTPVLIIRNRFPEFAFSFYMLPFALAAFLTIFLAPFFSSSLTSASPFEAIVEERDYYAHLEYQASFSMRPLNAPPESPYIAMPSFFIDKDGLPSVREVTAETNLNLNDFPPFPLKHMMDFFLNVNDGKKYELNKENIRNMELLPLLFLLIFILPGLFIRRKGGFPRKGDFASLKRFSANLRLKGINRNKTLLYNNREQLRILKDA